MPLKSEKTKLDSKGRIVLPSRQRESFGFKVGARLEAVPTRKGILIRKARPEPDHWDSALGVFNRPGNPFRHLTTQQYMDLVRPRD